jgi:hypothetical protein
MRAMPAERRRKSKAITPDPQDNEAYDLRGLVSANQWTLERAIADQSAKSLAGDNDAIVRSRRCRNISTRVASPKPRLQSPVYPALTGSFEPSSSRK